MLVARPELVDVDDYGSAMGLNGGIVPAELEETARLAIADCHEFAISVAAD